MTNTNNNKNNDTVRGWTRSGPCLRGATRIPRMIDVITSIMYVYIGNIYIYIYIERERDRKIDR